MDKAQKIYVAGHTGMVGSAVVRCLKSHGFNQLILRTHQELDLLKGLAVEDFFAREKPDAVVLAAARVGGIKANMDFAAEFLYENLQIQNHVIHAAFKHRVKKFCFLGSSCMYPRLCPQPMKAEYILTGALEPTNEAYALAKITGLKMTESYRRQYGLPGISVIPANLYGTHDHFDPEHSHVLAALVKKFVDAVENGTQRLELWGTGAPRRDFMHVDDAAEGIVCLLNNYDGAEPVNIGWGEDVSIRDLAQLIAQEAGFQGEIAWDTSRPDGMPRKCLDVEHMRAIGFKPKITLKDGIKKTIEEYRSRSKF